MSLELKFLGVGAGFSHPDLGNTSAIIYNNEYAGEGFVMIDCGESARQQLIRDKVDLANLIGVVITHTHGDHVHGLEMLGFWFKFVLHKKLNVYVPCESIKNDIVKMLEPTMSESQTETGISMQTPIEDFFNFHVGKFVDFSEQLNLVMLAFRVQHVAGKASFAYMIKNNDFPNKVHVWSGDIKNPVFENNNYGVTKRVFGAEKTGYVFHDCQVGAKKSGAVHCSLGELQEVVNLCEAEDIVLMHYGSEDDMKKSLLFKNVSFAQKGSIYVL